MEISRLTDNTNLYNVVKDSTDLSPGFKRPLGITHIVQRLNVLLTFSYMSHFSYACKMRYPINLLLENCEYLWFYLTFWIVILDYGLKLHKLFDSYPCHASEMIINTLNHCLKFPLHSISCHICYRKISEKIFNTVIKVKLLVSKASNSCFKGLDFFQMLLASHR